MLREREAKRRNVAMMRQAAAPQVRTLGSIHIQPSSTHNGHLQCSLLCILRRRQSASEQTLQPPHVCI